MLPPISDCLLQVQPSQQFQHYAPYAQSHEASYPQTSYGPSTEQQHGRNNSLGDSHAFPTEPLGTYPGRILVKIPNALD